MTDEERRYLKRIEQSLAQKVAQIKQVPKPDGRACFLLAVDVDYAYLLHRAVRYYISRWEKIERL